MPMRAFVSEMLFFNCFWLCTMWKILPFMTTDLKSSSSAFSNQLQVINGSFSFLLFFSISKFRRFKVDGKAKGFLVLLELSKMKGWFGQIPKKKKRYFLLLLYAPKKEEHSRLICLVEQISIFIEWYYLFSDVLASVFVTANKTTFSYAMRTVHSLSIRGHCATSLLATNKHNKQVIWA